MENLGFIGLGTMGKPMALNLLNSGHRVFLHSRSGVPAELTQAKGVACSDPKEVARRSDVVFTMVPDTPDVEKVLFGPNGIAEGLSAGKIVADMSTISAIETRRFAARINELGCEYLDAPVSGGEIGAKAGTLTVMVGGTQKAFEAVKPFFERMGKTITLIGANGSGQICKMANQIVVALTIEAVGEALLLASKAGADPAKVRQALMGGFAGSRVLEVHGARMIERTFEPGFRIELHQKDLALVLAAARDLGVAVPGAALAQQLFSASAAQGNARLDNSAMVRALEALAGHQVATGDNPAATV